jgi:hypothetical protein
MGDTPSNGASVPDLGMSDLAQCSNEERAASAKQFISLCFSLTCHGADPNAVVKTADSCELRYQSQVNEKTRLSEAQIQEGHQALATCQNSSFWIAD